MKGRTSAGNKDSREIRRKEYSGPSLSHAVTGTEYPYIKRAAIL
jgi:hypothetical protein